MMLSGGVTDIEITRPRMQTSAMMPPVSLQALHSTTFSSKCRLKTFCAGGQLLCRWTASVHAWFLFIAFTSSSYPTGARFSFASSAVSLFTLHPQPLPPILLPKEAVARHCVSPVFLNTCLPKHFVSPL
jgi:hypothetical protein